MPKIAAVERREAMRFLRKGSETTHLRLAALHAPHFRGHTSKLTSRDARERLRVAERKWLFENRIWKAKVTHAVATPTIVITGLVPVIHVFFLLK